MNFHFHLFFFQKEKEEKIMMGDCSCFIIRLWIKLASEQLIMDFGQQVLLTESKKPVAQIRDGLANLMNDLSSSI